MIKGMARKLSSTVSGALWEGTSKLTDTGGGATDVVAIRQPNGEIYCSSFHAQLPRLNKMDMLGCRVQVFVNNLPTHICMVLDRENICCFEDGSYKPQPSELETLNLRNGRNSLRYELIHPCNNERRFSVKADLHLWQPQDKIVVVDIDGTVTKTDVAGYGAAKLGYEYIHVGVCEVVTSIARQGYRILFLTSRAITLAQSTREFLRSIGFANGGNGMPEFCLITTTETFLPSLVVGVRSADKFKTAALQEIVSAFTPHAQIRQSSEHKVPGWRTDTSPQMSQTRAAGAEKRRSNHALDASPRQANTLPATPHSGAAAGDEDVASQTSTQGAGSDSDAKLPLLAALAVANEVGRANTQMPATKREQAGQLSNRCARQQAIQPLFARGPLHLEDVARTVPAGRDPGEVFVCGIGNRLTDTAAYAAVGVPPSLNLLIDERSILRTMDGGTQASFDGYLSLLPHIQRLLPALDAAGKPISGGLEGKGTCPFDCDCDLLVL